MYDLFHVSKDAEFPLMRAIDITEKLNEDGPLQGYIKLTGIGEGVVTQAIFVETIEHYLHDDEIFRQKEYEELGGLDVQSQVIKSFYDFEPFAHLLSKNITFDRKEYGETYLGAGGQKRFYQLLKSLISELI